MVDLTVEMEKALQMRRNLRALAEQPAGALAEPDKLLAQVAPLLDVLPPEQGAPAAFELGRQYARTGQWGLAREIFLLVADRYPAHPLAADACRWLIRHSASSEVRRRQELGQFLILKDVRFEASSEESEDGTEGAKLVAPRPAGKATGPLRFVTKSPDFRLGVVVNSEAGVMQNRAEARQWYENGLALEPRLRAFGPLFVSDPSVQFCLHAIRRNLGDVETARKWYAQFADRQPAGPWRDAALAELWLVNRTGTAPRPVLYCRQTDTKPLLDGKLDDACWQTVKPAVLRHAARGSKAARDSRERGGDSPEDTAGGHATEVSLAYDKEFLYIGLRCRQPLDGHVPLVKVRPRDADVRSHDRVSFLLDLDRDYATYYHIQFDQRGCVREEFCQDGCRDKSWNPRLFVACHSEPGVWQIEAALPLAALTGDPVTLGKAWACNVVRVVPGSGVDALSWPADVEPRPEGMGLLMFAHDPRRPDSGAGMPPAP
jgi:tetratricopeptide (TPR) repeat protein